MIDERFIRNLINLTRTIVASSIATSIATSRGGGYGLSLWGKSKWGY